MGGADNHPKKKKILPSPAKRQTFAEASAATNKKYAWTLAKLAGLEPSEAPSGKPAKRILPSPMKSRETLQESLKHINEKYAWTLRKLAESEETDMKK